MTDVELRKAIQRELIRRFNASKAKSQAIVITMKIDMVQLIIVPDWCMSRKRGVEYADMFTVYVDFDGRRIALPYMAACSIEELAYNITNYSGIDVIDSNDAFMYYMDTCKDFVAEYDMYEQDRDREEEYANNRYKYQYLQLNT